MRPAAGENHGRAPLLAFAFVAALAALPAAPAGAANWLEMNFYLSGPEYEGKLPEGDGDNVVVQFKQTAEAKPQNFRFKLDLVMCGECKRPEYACICEH